MHGVGLHTHSGDYQMHTVCARNRYVVDDPGHPYLLNAAAGSRCRTGNPLPDLVFDACPSRRSARVAATKNLILQWLICYLRQGGDDFQVDRTATKQQGSSPVAMLDL